MWVRAAPMSSPERTVTPRGEAVPVGRAKPPGAIAKLNITCMWRTPKCHMCRTRCHRWRSSAQAWRREVPIRKWRVPIRKWRVPARRWSVQFDRRVSSGGAWIRKPPSPEDALREWCVSTRSGRVDAPLRHDAARARHHPFAQRDVASHDGPHVAALLPARSASPVATHSRAREWNRRRPSAQELRRM